MTWASFASRTLSLLLVLPLLLTSLATNDIALWFLFQSVIGLWLVVDLGFTPTFTRLTAYALGGVAADELADMRTVGPYRDEKGPNLGVLRNICALSRQVYLWVALIAFGIVAVGGTAAVSRLVEESTDIVGSWGAWALIVLVSPFAIYGNRYRSYLQGVNQIALLRRWEAVFSTFGILTSIVILILGGGILALSIGAQFWTLATFVRNRMLSYRFDRGGAMAFRPRKVDVRIWRAVWPSAWRSGMTVLIHRGIILGSGVFYAQLGEPASVASFLLALRLAQTISEFSQAPFYTKIPRLAFLHAEGKVYEQVQLAERFMRLSFWSFVVPFVVLGLLGDWLFSMIGSKAPFPDPALWLLFALAFFFERYGAMHAQLYSTTNHIVTHIANSITGIIWLVGIYELLPSLGVYAFPVSFLIGNAGFYAWYCARYSYSIYSLGFWKFEWHTSAAPFIALTFYCLYVLIYRMGGL